MKYSSKLLSRQAFGLNRESFVYFSLMGPMRSRISSQTNTLSTVVPHFFRNISATSRIARLSSIERYWSTPVIPVVAGAISEVMRSNCPISKLSRNVRIFSNSKTLSWRRWILGKPKFESIFCISIPTTFPSCQTIFAITWRKLPGALATSRTFIFGLMSQYFSWISSNLKALLAR